MGDIKGPDWVTAIHMPLYKPRSCTEECRNQFRQESRRRVRTEEDIRNAAGAGGKWARSSKPLQHLPESES